MIQFVVLGASMPKLLEVKHNLIWSQQHAFWRLDRYEGLSKRPFWGFFLIPKQKEKPGFWWERNRVCAIALSSSSLRLFKETNDFTDIIEHLTIGGKLRDRVYRVSG
jgi:hypothetical protein